MAQRLGRSSIDGYTDSAIAVQAGEGLVIAVDPHCQTMVAATLGGKATWILSRDRGF